MRRYLRRLLAFLRGGPRLVHYVRPGEGSPICYRNGRRLSTRAGATRETAHVTCRRCNALIDGIRTAIDEVVP